jgi:hypothetical protein
MEFLQGNWFSLLCVGVYVVTELIRRGRKDEKMDQVIEKLDSFDEKLDDVVRNFNDHVETYNTHVANPDIHVNLNLRQMLDSKFELLHTAVRGVKETLDKM